MYKAIIWDLDGVLIESEPFLIKAEVQIFNKFGFPLTEEISKEYLGYKLDDYLKALGERFFWKLPGLEIKAVLHKRIEELYDKEIPLTPGSKEALEVLEDKFKFALATSREKHLAQKILKRHKIDQEIIKTFVLVLPDGRRLEPKQLKESNTTQQEEEENN